MYLLNNQTFLAKGEFKTSTYPITLAPTSCALSIAASISIVLPDNDAITTIDFSLNLAFPSYKNQLHF